MNFTPIETQHLTKKEALDYQRFLAQESTMVEQRLTTLQNENQFIAHSIDWENLLRFGGSNHSTIYEEQKSVFNSLSPVGFVGSYNANTRQWILEIKMDSNYLLVPFVKAIITSALPHIKHIEQLDGPRKVFYVRPSTGNGKVDHTLDIADTGECELNTFYRGELETVLRFPNLEEALYQLPVYGTSFMDNLYHSQTYKDMVERFIRVENVAALKTSGP